MHVCFYACMHACMHACAGMYVCMYVCTYVCMSAHTGSNTRAGGFSCGSVVLGVPHEIVQSGGGWSGAGPVAGPARAGGRGCSHGGTGFRGRAAGPGVRARARRCEKGARHEGGGGGGGDGTRCTSEQYGRSAGGGPELGGADGRRAAVACTGGRERWRRRRWRGCRRRWRERGGAGGGGEGGGQLRDGRRFGRRGRRGI